MGGMRVTNTDEEASYVGQRETEWTDYPAGRGSDEPTSGPINEAIFLSLAEQEVTAVEDEALREAALGGPDTCGARPSHPAGSAVARSTVPSCEDAFAQVLLDAHGETATFDPATMRLESKARLRVDYLPPPEATDICQPTAQAGFLGPDNQLIRVQVLDTNTMLWGWDNASFLYRVTSPTSLAPTRRSSWSGSPSTGLTSPAWASGWSCWTLPSTWGQAPTWPARSAWRCRSTATTPTSGT